MHLLTLSLSLSLTFLSPSLSIYIVRGWERKERDGREESEWVSEWERSVEFKTGLFGRIKTYKTYIRNETRVLSLSSSFFPFLLLSFPPKDDQRRNYQKMRERERRRETRDSSFLTLRWRRKTKSFSFWKHPISSLLISSSFFSFFLSQPTTSWTLKQRQIGRKRRRRKKERRSSRKEHFHF